MKTIRQIAKATNVTTVTTAEFEDGIGTQVGVNFVKDEKFYTIAEMTTQIGYELKFTSGNFQAKTANDAVKQLETALSNAGVVAYELTAKLNEYKHGEWFVRCNYIK